MQSGTWPLVSSNSSVNKNSSYRGVELRRIKYKSAAINPFTLQCTSYNSNRTTANMSNNCNYHHDNYLSSSVNSGNDDAHNSKINSYDQSSNELHAIRGNNCSSVSHVLEQTKVERWANHVHDMMQTHKSVFVAADVVLHELQHMKSEVGNSVALCLSTIFTVLQFCIPRLGKEQQAMLNAAVEELIPIITFSQLVEADCDSNKSKEAPIKNFIRDSHSTNHTHLPHIMSSEEANFSSLERTTCVQRTYAECFHNVLAQFSAYLHASRVHERREKIETLVMERVVSALDALWLKLCFKAWRAHIMTLQAIKIRFRQLLERGMNVDVIPHFIYKWRQHAHTFMLREKMARLGEVNKILKSLEPVFQSVHSQRDRLSVEITEKMHHLEVNETALRECKERYKALVQLNEETQISIDEHQRLWRECLQMLFNDAYRHNDEWRKSNTEPHAKNRFTSNITDTAALFMSRARARTDHVGPGELWQLLVRNGVVLERIWRFDNHSSSDEVRYYEQYSSHVENKQDNNNNNMHYEQISKSSQREEYEFHRHHHHQHYYEEQPCMRSGVNTDVLINKVAQTCAPVVAPLTVHDVLSDNQATMKFTFMFLECIFGGGHCSLFQRVDNTNTTSISHVNEKSGIAEKSTCQTTWDNKANVNTESQLIIEPFAKWGNSKEECSDGTAHAESVHKSDCQQQSRSNEECERNNCHISENDGVEDNEEEEKDCCSRMIDQITNGVESLQDCKDAHDEYLMHIHRCMTGGNLELIQDMLGTFYAQWSRLGKPLDRSRMENALTCIVSFHDKQVLRALYPNNGLSTLVELTHYLSSVAEFVNWPLINIVEWITTHYVFTIEEMHQLEFSSKSIVHFFRSHADNVKLFYERVKDDAQMAHVSHDKLEECFTKYLDISYDEFDQVLKDVNRKFGSEEGGDALQRDNLEFLLFTAAKVHDPSPFTALIDKLHATM